jgi:hypothetical protein
MMSVLKIRFSGCAWPCLAVEHAPVAPTVPTRGNPVVEQKLGVQPSVVRHAQFLLLYTEHSAQNPLGSEQPHLTSFKLRKPVDGERGCGARGEAEDADLVIYEVIATVKNAASVRPLTQGAHLALHGKILADGHG